MDLLRDDYSYFSYTGPKVGFSPNLSGGAGMYYSAAGGEWSFNPGAGIDAGGGYTWVWGK